MKKTRLICIIILLTAIGIAKAQNYTISGHVTDEKSGETLISSSVFDLNSNKGTVTNVYGFYSITLSKKDVELVFSNVGYRTQRRVLNLTKDTIINIKLNESIELSEVTVIGNHKEIGVKGSQMSAIDVPIAQIKSIPALFGETDVMKALQLLPGVKSGVEGTAGFYVRGGGPDENLILLDGVPVYNVNHVFGLFSVFNADAIKNVTLYKGSFPARFGGRLSSVVDIRLNDGNFQELHGNVSVGLISSKINLEGPIIKNKTSFNFSARRTYGDILMMPFVKLAAGSEGIDASLAAYFYDLNLKINHKISDKDRLYLSTYMGDDVLAVKSTISESYDDYGTKTVLKENLNFNWGNIVTALRWNHVISNKLFMNTTASYTRYRYDLGVGFEETLKGNNIDDTQYLKVGFKSGIEDYTLKADFDYAPSPNHAIKFGLGYINHTFRPGVKWSKQHLTIDSTTLDMDTIIGDKNIYSHETQIYFEDNYTINHFLKANIGLQHSAFFVQGKPYSSFQPRLGVRYLVNDNFSFKMGYAYMSQYIHLLSSSNISLPTDLWVPVTKNVVPMISNQYSFGTFYSIPKWVDLSVETYYKSMDNLIEYKDGASFMGSGTGWENKINMGRGWAYGVEFLAQRSFGATTGWIGYTWSKTERLFDRPGQEINNGIVFPAKYDRRHDISIVVSHKFSNRIDASATWVYSTGNSGTIALQEYESENIQGAYGYFYSSGLGHITKRNNYRLPDYNRLDLGINFHKQLKHGVRTWNFGIYNAYNRLNPFMIYKTFKNGNPALAQISLLPFLPSVSYSYKF
jgi:outer membrane receptor for ferrienterochelin and colicin